MQLHHVIAAALVLPRNSNFHGRGAIAAFELCRVAVGLADHHVAAVAAASLEIASARGAFLDRSDHFDEVVADRQQRILQAERADSGIDKADFESEHGLEVIDYRRELVGDQRNLAKSNRHGFLLLNWLIN